MLVLSRHRDESIIIGDDIVITVVDIRGNKVRLGIAAPIEISVHRQEVYEAIQRERRRVDEERGVHRPIQSQFLGPMGRERFDAPISPRSSTHVVAIPDSRVAANAKSNPIVSDYNPYGGRAGFADGLDG